MILITGTSCAGLSQKTYRSNSDCEVAALSKETINFIKECKPPNSIKVNLARVQIAGAINNNLNNREPIIITKEWGIGKYFVAAGIVIVGWWITVKVVLGGLFGWLF